MIDKAVLDALKAAFPETTSGRVHECTSAREYDDDHPLAHSPTRPLVHSSPRPLAHSSTRPPARSLAFFDLDGTMARGHMIFDFPAHLLGAGLFRQSTHARILDMQSGFRRGRITYRNVAEELPRLYAEGVKGEKAAALALEAEKFVEGRMGGVFPYARPLVMLMREHGRPGLAISGSPIETVRALSRRLGMEAALGTQLKTRNGAYTGKVACNFILRETKRATFKELVGKLRLDTSACFGFGDTEQDESFLSLVGHPVCLNPSAELRGIALKNGWPMFSRTQDVVAKVKRLAVRADAV